jgi:polysaccharide pyruvyl transferase WcaK-like protein
MALQEARKLNKFVMLVGIGVGTPKTRVARQIFAQLFKQTESFPVLVRDSKSASVADRFLARSGARAIVNPDNAFVAIHALKSKIRANPIPGLVGLAPISRYVLSESLKQQDVNSDVWWIEILVELRSRSLNPVLFCSGTQRDFERCQLIKQKAAEQGISIRVLDRPKSAQEFLEQLASFEHILCQRLHISISFFALGGFPTALAWDEKVQAFFCENQLGHRVLVGPEASVASTCDLITSEGGRIARSERLASAVINGIRSAIRNRFE